MKKVISIVLLLGFVFTSSIECYADDKNEWQDAYANFLRSNVDEGMGDSNAFTIRDMYNDGVSELLVSEVYFGSVPANLEYKKLDATGSELVTYSINEGNIQQNIYGGETVSTVNTNTSSTYVVFNGQPLNLDKPVINKNGRTYYPFRQLLEAVGAEVEWVDETKTAIGTLNGNRVEFTINSNSYKVNGKTMNMEDGESCFIDGDSTYIPIRYACEGLGLTVTWDEKSNTIYINETVPSTDDGGDIPDTEDVITTEEAFMMLSEGNTKELIGYEAGDLPNDEELVRTDNGHYHSEIYKFKSGEPDNITLFFDNEGKGLTYITISTGDFYGLSVGSDNLDVIVEILGAPDEKGISELDSKPMAVYNFETAAMFVRLSDDDRILQIDYKIENVY